MNLTKTELSDIAYFAVDVPSHVFPFIGFLQELEFKGLHFDVYGSKKIISGILSDVGKNHFEFEELDYKPNSGIAEILETVFHSHLKTIPAIEKLWKDGKSKPKLILADMFAKHSEYLAKKYKIPLIVLYSTYFVQNCKPLFATEIIEQLKIPVDEKNIPLKKEVEEKFGVNIDTFGKVLTTGDHNISCLPKFVGDIVTPEVKGFTYVGPAFRNENKLDTFEIDSEFFKGNDIIYVSLGTAPLNKQGFSFYENIIEALGNTEHKVLISAAMGKAKELSDKGLPKNIVVKSWVPQMKVLEHSKLFISHVGAGGMIEAIYKGVPIMAVPNFADQPINAEVVENLNFGRWLKDKTSDGIKKLVDGILGNKDIKASHKKHQALINPQKSRESFVEIVQSMMEK